MDSATIKVVAISLFVLGMLAGIGVGAMLYHADSTNLTGTSCIGKPVVPNVVVEVKMPNNTAEMSDDFRNAETTLSNKLSENYSVEFVDIGWDTNNFLRVYMYSRGGAMLNSSDEVFRTAYSVFPNADLYYIIKEQPDARVIMATETQLRLNKFPKIVYYNTYAVEQIAPIRNHR